jgi:hypothetical protein
MIPLRVAMRQREVCHHQQRRARRTQREIEGLARLTPR